MPDLRPAREGHDFRALEVVDQSGQVAEASKKQGRRLEL
jgi:hypothetical protein